MLDRHAHGGVAHIRASAGEHPINNGTEGINIAAPVNLHALRLFGAHVGRRTDNGAAGNTGLGVARFRNTKIGEIGLPGAIKQDVAGL